MAGPVLVIGATGKTGKLVIDALRRRGIETRAATRRPAASSGDGSTVAFHWSDPSGWPAALKGVEGLYLVKPKHDEPQHAVAAMLAKAPRLRRVVLLSEILCETRPADDPHRATELAVQRSGIPWTILRPNWFLQNFTETGFAEALRIRGEIAMPAGDAAISWIDTRDVADAAVTALTSDAHAGEAATLTGPTALSAGALAHLLGQAAGRPFRHADATLDATRAQLASTGASAKLIAFLMGLYADMRAGAIAFVTDDVQRMTGHAPRTAEAFAVESAALLRDGARAG